MQFRATAQDPIIATGTLVSDDETPQSGSTEVSMRLRPMSLRASEVRCQLAGRSGEQLADGAA
jgi:hypothetical protein